MGVHFEIFVSLCAPVPGLLVSLGIDIELGQKGLDIALILDGWKASLEVLGESQLLVDVSLACWFGASSAAW